MLPSSSELSYFVEVANTLNISRAAERLGITQPTLSLAIKRLEDSFGVPLLVRTKSGVTLTNAGNKLLFQARELLLEWERIRQIALEDEKVVRGTYTIGCHPSVAMYTLPSTLPKILEKFPYLEIKLTHNHSRRITEDVISFKVDFGIVVNPWEHPDLVIREICKDEVGLWVSSKPSPLQNPTNGEAVLICDTDMAQAQSLLRQMKKKSISFKRMVTSSNLEVITQLVADGAGIGILPTRVAERDKGLKLNNIKKGALKFQDRHCLVYRADAQKSLAAKEIARTLTSALRSQFN